MIGMDFSEKPSVTNEKDQLLLTLIFGNKSTTYQVSESISSSVTSKIKSHNNGMAEETKSHCGIGFLFNKFEMVQTAATTHNLHSQKLTFSLE